MRRQEILDEFTNRASVLIGLSWYFEPPAEAQSTHAIAHWMGTETKRDERYYVFVP